MKGRAQAHGRACFVKQLVSRFRSSPPFATSLTNFGIDKDTSKPIRVAPLLNPKFASAGSANLCELRVRGTSAGKTTQPQPLGHSWVTDRKRLGHWPPRQGRVDLHTPPGLFL